MKLILIKFIVSSGLLCFSFLLCLGLGEVVVRKLNLVPTTSIKIKELSPSRLSYLPNSSWQYSEPEFTENVQINSIGFRDYEPQLESPSILFLGDSQTYGTGVQLGERASDLIGNYLSKFCNFKKSKVVNISMPGASTKKELMMLEEALSKGLKLNHIFLMVVSNDHSQNFHEDGKELSKIQNKNFSDKSSIGLKSRAIKLLRSVRYESHLAVASLKAVSEVKFLRELYAESKIMGGLGEIFDTEILYYENDKIQPQIQSTKKYIELISKYAPTTVVMVPDRYRFDSSLQASVSRALISRGISEAKINYDTEREVLKDTLRTLDVDIIDPIQVFREVSEKESLYYPINGHLNSSGQSLLASSVARKSKFIDEVCSSYSSEEFDSIGDVDPTDQIMVQIE